MSDLTRAQKLSVIRRDRERCLRCGRRPATFQHRRAKGMGGVGPKGKGLTLASGCALCAECNARAEGDIQQDALLHGWKIPRSCPIDDTEIPVLDALSGNWWLLDEDGERRWVESDEAVRLINRALAA